MAKPIDLEINGAARQLADIIAGVSRGEIHMYLGQRPTRPNQSLEPLSSLKQT